MLIKIVSRNLLNDIQKYKFKQTQRSMTRKGTKTSVIWLWLAVDGKKNSMKGGDKKEKEARAATSGNTNTQPEEGEICGTSHNSESQ